MRTRSHHLPRPQIPDLRQHPAAKFVEIGSGGNFRLFTTHSRGRRPRRSKRFPCRHMHQFQSLILPFRHRNCSHEECYHALQRHTLRFRRRRLRPGRKILSTANPSRLGAQDHQSPRSASRRLHRYPSVHPTLRPRDADQQYWDLCRFRRLYVWGFGC